MTIRRGGDQAGYLRRFGIRTYGSLRRKRVEFIFSANNMSVPTTLRKSAAPASRKASARTRPLPARLGFPQRREFLELPLAQRRELLKAQAADARAYYTASTDLREWEAADLTSPADE